MGFREHTGLQIDEIAHSADGRRVAFTAWGRVVVDNEEHHLTARRVPP